MPPGALDEDELNRRLRQTQAGLDADRAQLLDLQGRIERLTIAQQLLRDCGFQDIVAANNNDATWVCPHRDTTGSELQRLGGYLDSAMDTIRRELQHANLTAQQLGREIRTAQTQVTSLNQSIRGLQATAASTAPTPTTLQPTSSLNGPR
jgi:hypothetical protein